MVASVVGTNSPLLPFVKILPRKGRVQKPKRPAPPTNMYILYFQDQYREYLVSYLKPFYDIMGGRSMRKFARDVANKWRNLPQAEKDKYRQKYLILRQAKLDQEALAQQQQQAQAMQQQQALALRQAQLAGQQFQQVQVPQMMAPQQQVPQVTQQLLQVPGISSASTSAQGQAPAPQAQGSHPNP